jgi:hypothetical protein
LIISTVDKRKRKTRILTPVTADMVERKLKDKRFFLNSVKPSDRAINAVNDR